MVCSEMSGNIGGLKDVHVSVYYSYVVGCERYMYVVSCHCYVDSSPSRRRLSNLEPQTILSDRNSL